MTEPQTFNDLPTKAVRVRATVKFDAYIVDPQTSDDDLNDTDLFYRIGEELNDAIMFRAPHLSDTKDGDVLVALVHGGMADTCVAYVEDVSELPTSVVAQLPQTVEEAVAHTEAWL